MSDRSVTAIFTVADLKQTLQMIWNNVVWLLKAPLRN